MKSQTHHIPIHNQTNPIFAFRRGFFNIQHTISTSLPLQIDVGIRIRYFRDLGIRKKGINRERERKKIKRGVKTHPEGIYHVC